MKKYIVITGGAGFVGSNLIEFLIKKTNKKIISIDNYSSGYVRNHIKSNKVKYIKGNTANINQILARYKNKIDSLFHFGEFARIFKSFKKFNDCFQSNSIGSKEVFKFCLDNNVRLIYSATSASLGNNGNDKNLSPYSFTKAKNLELLENLKKWFNLKFDIIYFYNVYGPKQIKSGEMATVIGIFEDLYEKDNIIKNYEDRKYATNVRIIAALADDVNNCIADTSSFGKVEVVINPLPVAVINPSDITIYLGEEVSLTVGNYSFYEWYTDNDSLISTQSILTVQDSGKYKVWVEDENGCTDISELAIVRSVPLTQIFVPSVFTPNADQHNELFVIKGLYVVEFNIKIFDRWGEQVFEENNIDKYWDGKYNSKKVPQGTYYYNIEVLGVDGKLFKKSGTVQVLY